LEGVEIQTQGWQPAEAALVEIEISAGRYKFP
jgi:hypothetical protein